MKLNSTWLYFYLIICGVAFTATALKADPTGDCTTGQYCEQSSLDTTNTTTTTNSPNYYIRM